MNFTPHNLFTANHCAIDALWPLGIGGFVATADGAKRKQMRCASPMILEAHGKPAF